MDPFSPQVLGSRIRELRRRRRLTSAALAAAAGISQPFVIEIEQGKKTPSFTTLERVARALDVSLGTLLDSGRGVGRRVPVVEDAICLGWLRGEELRVAVSEGKPYFVADIEDPNAFYIEAQGPAMTGGRILPGDILLVSPKATVEPGDTVLAAGENGLMVRRLHQRGTDMFLQPLSAAGSSVEMKLSRDVRVYRIVRVEFRM